MTFLLQVQVKQEEDIDRDDEQMLLEEGVGQLSKAEGLENIEDEEVPGNAMALEEDDIEAESTAEKNVMQRVMLL